MVSRWTPHWFGRGRRRGTARGCRRHPDPGGFRRARDRGQGRGRADRAREGDSPTSASASGCRSPSSSLRATSAGWTAPTRPSSIPETPYPVVDLLPEQKESSDLGGTIAPRGRSGEAPRRDRRRGRSSARRSSTSATATAMRSTTHAAPPPRGRGPGGERDLARRAPGRGDRAPRPPLLRSPSQFHPELTPRPTAQNRFFLRVRRCRGPAAPSERGEIEPVADSRMVASQDESVRKIKLPAANAPSSLTCRRVTPANPEQKQRRGEDHLDQRVARGLLLVVPPRCRSGFSASAPSADAPRRRFPRCRTRSTRSGDRSRCGKPDLALCSCFSSGRRHRRSRSPRGEPGWRSSARAGTPMATLSPP